MSIKSILVIFSVSMVTISLAIKCDPTICDRVRCMAVSQEDCEVTQNGVYLPRDPQVCRCCPKCIRKINEGEDCGLTLIRGVEPIALCAPGLLCDSQTRTCVKRAVCDNC